MELVEYQCIVIKSPLQSERVSPPVSRFYPPCIVPTEAEFAVETQRAHRRGAVITPCLGGSVFTHLAAFRGAHTEVSL